MVDGGAFASGNANRVAALKSAVCAALPSMTCFVHCRFFASSPGRIALYYGDVVSESTLLLDLGVPFGRKGTQLFVETQALNGLRLWAKHFDRVTVCAPELSQTEGGSTTIVWADPAELLAGGRHVFEPFPWGYHPRDHFRHRSEVSRRYDKLVSDHRHLCFSNLGAFGAWGNFGVAAARRQKHKFSLWFDWVVHKMASNDDGSMKERIRNRLYSAITKRNTYSAIHHCDLGLFHGQTVYDAYSPLCRQPELVHDVHVSPDDAISEREIHSKLTELDARSSLRIGYVGRTHPMKAPFQWIDAIAEAVKVVGAERIEAVWIGDGPLLEDARAKVRELGLEACIRFDGFVSDRSAVLNFLRQQDLLLFCHVTPESPRCLIEALISGTALVGYESSYARELVGNRGGAILSPIGDSSTLAKSLIRLANERVELRRLISDAATSRAIYNDEAVFADRSELIKKYA
jgi:glycosyltransferase involved in cell wall biosynthesis